MKKYFKKFGIMFVMTLILSVGFCISAFADDNGVVGTNNLNNTVNNSAVVGSRLTAPEIGWKRYDDTNGNITYDGNGWTSGTMSSYYDNTWHQTNGASNFINFKFYGTKLRIIDVFNTVSSGRSDSIQITIDGTPYTYSEASSIAYYILNFELTGLNKGVHTVKIQNMSPASWFGLDAIDIDDTGYLIGPNESITLDESSIDLKVGDSQQLTATTTPAEAQVTWTSSDSSIATVDLTGNVTGIKEGTCTITATNPDGLTAICAVNVTPKDTTTPTEPTGDANLYIELVDGQIKQYTVSSDEINKFTEWYETRDTDHSLPATYKFTKGSYTDYVVQNQIDWFEVR